MDSTIIKNKITTLLAFGLWPKIELSNPAINRIEGKFLAILKYKKDLAASAEKVLQRLEGLGLTIDKNAKEKYIIDIELSSTKINKEVKLINKTMMYGDRIKLHTPVKYPDNIKEFERRFASEATRNSLADEDNITLEDLLDGAKFEKALKDRLPKQNDTKVSLEELKALEKNLNCINLYNRYGGEYYRWGELISFDTPLLKVNALKLNYNYMEKDFVISLQVAKIGAKGYTTYKLKHVEIPYVAQPLKPEAPVPLAETEFDHELDLDIEKFSKRPTKLHEVAEALYCKRIDSLTEELLVDDPCGTIRTDDGLTKINEESSKLKEKAEKALKELTEANNRLKTLQESLPSYQNKARAQKIIQEAKMAAISKNQN